MWVIVNTPFGDARARLRRLLLTQGQEVEQPPHAMKTADPDWAITTEVQNVTLELDVPMGQGDWAWYVRPNLPWAEDHFQERIGGQPLNPSPEEANWPYAVASNSAHKNEAGQFSHTYPERMWPKFASVGVTRPNGREVFVPHNGIRFEYGDLADVIQSLKNDPNTRQAYLPIWFPEDTGMPAREQERVPCSLGYHFMQRGRGMQCTYYLRSCDFRRYFTDDVYMAGRLLQHVAREVQGLSVWTPGKLIIHIASLHVFRGDLPAMESEEGA